MALGCLQLEVAQQFLPDGAAAEHLHPLGQGRGLLRHQTEQVLHHAAVAGTGVLTPAHDRLRAQEADPRGRGSPHHHAVVPRRLEHHHFAEHAAGAQMLQNGAAALPVDPLHHGAALGYDAQHPAAVAEIIDHVVGPEALLIHAQACVHGLVFLGADALQKR